MHAEHCVLALPEQLRQVLSHAVQLATVVFGKKPGLTQTHDEGLVPPDSTACVKQAVHPLTPAALQVEQVGSHPTQLADVELGKKFALHTQLEGAEPDNKEAFVLHVEHSTFVPPEQVRQVASQARQLAVVVVV